MNSFEKQFSKVPEGSTLVPVRTQAFDVKNGIFYSPLSYKEKKLKELKPHLPDNVWIKNQIHAFVKGEFGRSLERMYLQTSGDEYKTSKSLINLALEYRDFCEQDLVYAGSLEQILDEIPAAKIVERLYAILCSQDFGSKENYKNVTLADFQKMVSGLDVGLRIVIPGLPFRDQNTLRTNDAPSDITLAEAAFIIRLHCTALAAYQALPTGADTLVLSDGNIYANIFGVSKKDAGAYLDGTRVLRNQLNCEGTVSILDLEEVIQKQDASSGSFEIVQKHIEKEVEGFLNSIEPDDKLAAESLISGMRWNRSTDLISEDPSEVTSYFNSPSSPEYRDAEEAVKFAACTYVAINLTMRWFDTVKTMFPTCLRGTMHAKPGQLAMPSLGSCFPWNGVAISGSGDSFSDLEIHSLSLAAQRGYKLSSVKSSNGSIIYYKKVR